MPVQSSTNNPHHVNSAPPTRKTYETKHDLENEQFIMALLYNRQYRKLSRAYVADLFGYNPATGNPMLSEIKTRSRPLSDMKNGVVILSFLKYTNLKSFPIPSSLLIMCPDGLWEIPVDNCERNKNNLVDVHINGRVDRGDPNDLEPCVSYKVEKFKQLVNKKALEALRNEYSKNRGLSPETIQRILKETSN